MGEQAVSAAFGQDQAADLLPPGPVLADLADRAASHPLWLSDDELVGVLHAARRLANHAAWQQTVVIAEFARRRQAAFEAAKDAGIPVGCRPGEFPGGELAMELVDTDACAGARIDTAVELTTRLPATLAGMQAGVIDLDRACAIASRTAVMTGEDAAYADRVLAAAAPGLRPDQLARKAAALELKLAPDAVRARKELARRLDQRVEARREESGNASLSGRELDTADVIASKAHIDAIALRLRDSGLIEGNLGMLRALALTDLTQGRDPLDRIKPRPAAPGNDDAWDPSKAGDATGSEPPAEPGQEPAAAEPGAGQPDADDVTADEPAAGPRDADDVTADAPPGPAHGQGRAPEAGAGTAGEPGDDLGPGPARAGDPAPLPALINLLVPADTLLGWGTAPGQAAGWGLLDGDETRAVVRAASRHPRTRWCATVVGADGTAVAHGCAAGQHPWPGNGPPPPPSPPPPPPPGSPPGTPPPSGVPPRAPLAPGPAPAPRPHRPATRSPPAAEHHPGTHRTGHLRPPARREPLRPQPQAQAPHPRPQPDLLRPRLQRPGRLQRPRPHDPLPRRPLRRMQPHAEVPPPPPHQAGARLERHPAHPRHHNLDHPVRPRPHHNTNHVRPLSRVSVRRLLRR